MNPPTDPACSNFAATSAARKPAANSLCVNHANPLFARLAASQPKKEADVAHMNKAQLMQRSKELQHEQSDALAELQEAQARMVNLNNRIKAHAEQEMKNG